MKTMITSLVAIATSLSTLANVPLAITGTDSNDINPSKGNGSKAVVLPVSQNLASRLNRLYDAKEDQMGLLHYNQVMENVLTRLAVEKHLNAVDNLKAENSYSNLMNNALIRLESDKVENQIADLHAEGNFSHLMEQTLKLAGTK